MPRTPASFDPRSPFTRVAGLANGLSDRELQGRRYRRLFSGIYVSADESITPAVRAAAALLTVPQPAFASHVSAGRVHGVPLPAIPEEHVTVLHQAHRRTRRSGVVCHCVPHARVTTRDGVRISSSGQTFCELGSILPLVDLVIVGDWLLRHGRISRRTLRQYCADRTGAGAARARAAQRFVRERVDSPMETRLRMLLVLAGLPEPEINLPLRDELGDVVRRHDLSYPQVRVAIEYDGRHHVEREGQWEADLARREASDGEGWRTIVVTSRGTYREPAETLRRVHTVLRERRLARVARELSDDWRGHFSGADRPLARTVAQLRT